MVGNGDAADRRGERSEVCAVFIALRKEICVENKENGFVKHGVGEERKQGSVRYEQAKHSLAEES